LLKHPYECDLSASVGYESDPLVGFFVDCFHGEDILVFYRASEPNYERDQPLSGALRFLARLGFFTEHELDDALYALASSETIGVPQRVRRVMHVVAGFKPAAAGT
jgi:hypothetical protein